MRAIFTIVSLLLALWAGDMYAGVDGDREISGSTVMARVENGDTILIMELQPFEIIAAREFSSRRQERRYNRMVRNVTIVYPYAYTAGIMFREYLEHLETLDTERERRQFTREAEKMVRDHFEEDLKRLTFSQGLILLKLIDRETHHRSYDIVRDFRGAFSAVFWQSLARLFGFTLKTEYDPYGEDRMIEEIVQLIEAGLI